MATAIGLNRKKRVESHYMDEARRASSIFPSGELIQHERPDFLLQTDGMTIGIEVTELCGQEPRAEAGRLAKVLDKARERYGRLPNAKPVDVIVVFSGQAQNMSFEALTKSLSEFVYVRQDNKGPGFTGNLPSGYRHIGIHARMGEMNESGRWRGVRAFDTAVAPKQLIESRIAEKNLRLPDYRLSAAEIWLLIVNDQFLGPGEVYARPENLAEWAFVFDFEKVLLFSREPGGNGEVIELRRA
jgi:hypothetical protein